MELPDPVSSMCSLTPSDAVANVIPGSGQVIDRPEEIPASMFMRLSPSAALSYLLLSGLDSRFSDARG